MAGQAATAAIPHYVVAVFGLCLSDMATGTLLAQHRVRNTVPERLKIDRFIRTGVFVEQLSSHSNDASSVMHQVIRDGSNPCCDDSFRSYAGHWPVRQEKQAVHRERCPLWMPCYSRHGS